MKLFELIATLSLQSDAFNKGVTSAKTLALNAASNINNSLRSATRGIVNFAADMVKLGVQYNMQMENFQASFKVLLQSEEKAIAMTKQLQKTAAVTPFGMADLANATQTLLSYRVASEDVVDVLQEVGDIALGDKNKLSTLAAVYGQISMAGKLLGQDYKQLINVGFNPLTYIAQKTGETMEQLQNRMSKGGISAQEVAEAFKTATSEGNTFYKGMETASKTLTGQWSTLTDNWSQFWGEIMKPVHGELTDTVVPKLITKLQELSDAMFGVEEETKSLFTDENGNEFSPAAKINEWYDDLIKEWTDGRREDDETVRRFAESFKSNTKLIADAFRQRLDDTTLPDAERAEYEAKIARIEELNTAVEDLLKKRQGGYFTDEDKRNLQAYREELAALEQSLGTQAEAEKALTPWESFVHELGVLVAGDKGVIDAIGDMVIGFVKNGGLETVVGALNDFVTSLSDGTFQDALTSFVDGVSTIANTVSGFVGFFSESFDMVTALGEFALGRISATELWNRVTHQESKVESTGFTASTRMRKGGGGTASGRGGGRFSFGTDNTTHPSLPFSDVWEAPEIDRTYSNYAGRELHPAGRFTGESFAEPWWEYKGEPENAPQFGFGSDVEIRQGDITVMIDSKSIAYELSTNATLINGIAIALDQRSNRISSGKGQVR